MILPPGAPGGGSYQDADGSLWTERAPSVTFITWRPDGLVFAVGHVDGCIAFWAFSESDKPLMVRTITHEDVNVADAESLLESGALPSKDKKVERDQNGNAIVSAVSANREPIYKMVWASFPDQASLKALISAQGTPQAREPLTNATVELAERGETLLLILGGQSPGDKPGINILQFPAYKPPINASSKSPSESMPLQERYAFRDSLLPTGSFNWLTRTPLKTSSSSLEITLTSISHMTPSASSSLSLLIPQFPRSSNLTRHVVLKRGYFHHRGLMLHHPRPEGRTTSSQERAKKSLQ